MGNNVLAQLTHLLLVVQIDYGMVLLLLLSIYGHGNGCGIMQIRWTASAAPADEVDLVLLVMARVVMPLLVLLRQGVRGR